MTCQKCFHCKAKRWFVYCKHGYWKWEMLKGSELDIFTREQGRPEIVLPAWTNKFSKNCEKYEEV